MLCILRLTVQHIGTIGFMNHNSSCIWNISSVQLCMQNLCHRGQFPFDYLLVFLTVQKCYWWNVKWVSHKIYERRCMYNTPRGKHVWTISVGCMRGSRYVPRRDNFVFERGVLIFCHLKKFEFYEGVPSPFLDLHKNRMNIEGIAFKNMYKTCIVFSNHGDINIFPLHDF